MANHLTLDERKLLAQWRTEQLAKAEIARRLGRDRRTIQRELKRNGTTLGYLAVEAQAQAVARRRQPRRRRRMSDPVVDQFVRAGLADFWSPDQIAGRMRREFARRPGRCISRQTIYNWIARSGEDREYWEGFLRFGPRRRSEETRGKLPAVVSIAGRPKIVDQRRRYGDWEGDTLVGRARRSGLLTLVERKSGYLQTGKVRDLRAKTVRRITRRRLEGLPPDLRRTMTFDNGKEFADHEWITAHTGIAIYFAEPYCAWQRGSNENANGLLRQFFPKGTDFAEVSHHEVARITTLLNERPRKRLGYRTPAQLLAKRLPAAIGN
jgi:transposase, IS30 family